MNRDRDQAIEAENHTSSDSPVDVYSAGTHQSGTWVSSPADVSLV